MNDANGSNDTTEQTSSAPVAPKAKKARAPKKAKAKAAKKPVAKKAGARKPAKPKYVNVAGKCLCGCGGKTDRRFLPGHDAKLHGMVVDAFKEEKVLRVGKATAEYLSTAFYMKGNAKLKAVIRS